ncbi:MAG: hypothetical protein COZ06_16230 [Armatimonadetes bacterium CG_4_10_14_3_um_filter_66_18]|nr:tetratricopeptide repeat protein [Armatimonadota bacterium]PIU95743.1 MAG: hypothetical protein COS65_00860 [Armatimonadetes bacterium CG06_land_8_20_14_3_00_66_21]PIX45206.1 MAG: hypothetical protein COZ57_16005 [Armatimonadetes bacterium CG_4_8_14_3_um_filter_66_20]PIY48581.1 MAG: hypothetical protein COZ06_16230 [Armatimonadetes bacterium CG_4_10_14_3_um_filter_66_18]PIZ40284.1 MAG: hypothetical protein COY42_21580 [Armatimonadetes bacterium CG_4_10_14_0_8_um_filter_66_14]PJB63770.1 MAG:
MDTRGTIRVPTQSLVTVRQKRRQGGALLRLLLAVTLTSGQHGWLVVAEAAPTETQPVPLLLFPAASMSGVSQTVSARLTDAVAAAFETCSTVHASRLSPDLPAVKRAIAEKTVAPEALELLTSASGREVLCQALDIPFGLVFEELAPLPEKVGRKGLYVAATLIRTDGGKPRAFRSLAEDSQAVVDSVSDDTLHALASALVASVAEAIALVQAGQVKDTTTQATQLLQEAADQMAVGKYRLAVDGYNRALRFQPRDPDIYFRLGNAYAALDNYKGAVVAYRQSLFLQGDSTETMLALARAHQRLGETEPLLEICRKLTKRAPEVAENQKILAEALVSKHRALVAINSRQEADKVLEEARVAYRRAIELSDRKPELWREYADLLFASKDYSTAVGALREALKTTAEDAELRRLLWTSLLYNREYEAALDELLRDAQGDPNLRFKPDETLYRKLTTGLDRRARQTFLKATEKRQDFAADTLTREEFLQWTKEFLAETDRMTDLADRVTAPARYERVHLARQFAFALMGQWALNEQRYVETLDALYADQAVVKQKCAAQSFDEVHRLEREQS